MNGKSLFRIAFYALLFLSISSLSYGAQANEFVFQQTSGIRIEVLSQVEFTARFGNNPDIPRTEAGIINLAMKLFPPIWEKHYTNRLSKQSGFEYEIGILFAALKNPYISNSIRWQVDQIIQQSEPSLPKTYTSGHFKFYYTDNDSDAANNSTLANIKKTANSINSYWNQYKAKFTTPKNYRKYILFGTQMIDIKVYNCNIPGWIVYGWTSSSTNYIVLNSIDTVPDDCNRKTTSAHELFHRVQYSYGYESGYPNMEWMVEGTAAWSQKFTNQPIRDYMKRMDDGLRTPDVPLFDSTLPADAVVRNYDAVHFWVYLEERTNWSSIRDVWKTYKNNGQNGKAAVETVVGRRPLSTNFEGYVQLWIQANYMKDLNNARSGKYDYAEDETTKVSCGRNYGPLGHVDRLNKEIVDDQTSWARQGHVSAYGADYYELSLRPALTNLKIQIDGAATGDFSYHFIGIKSYNWKNVQNTTANTYTYTKTLAADEWDTVMVIVGGRSAGGNYRITVGNVPPGTLSGMVTDATTGNPIGNATISCGGLSTTSLSDGNYTLSDVLEGTYTVTCQASDYADYASTSIAIISGQTTTLNISLSPHLAVGEIRFILTWGATPNDLDSHLKTPLIGGVSYHVYYVDKGSQSAPPYATLDIDDTSGYGPETITIFQRSSGTYQYFVHDFTNRSGTGQFPISGASVQIYDLNGLVTTITVPAIGTGTYWDVCSVDGTSAQITIINQIVDALPAGQTSIMNNLPNKKGKASSEF